MNNAKFVTLDNGLTVLIYSDKSKITSYFRLYTFIGGNSSYYNFNGKTKKVYKGTAHLLEHYVCENSSSGNIMNSLRKLKVLDGNAVTNTEMTTYYFHTASNFEEAMVTALKSVYDTSFSKEGLEKTKKAVFSEIRDDKDDDNRKVKKRKIKNIFNVDNDVLGSTSSIKKIGYRYLKEVYDTFYVPKNQFLVVAGNFDEEHIISVIKDIYSNLEFKNNSRVISFVEDSNVRKKEDVIVDKNSLINEIIVSFKIDTSNMKSFDRYKFDWYLGYFCDINFSRFSSFNEIVRKDFSCKGDVSSGTYINNGYEIFEVLLYTSDFDRIRDLIFDTIKDFRNNKEDDFELRKKESKMRISVRKDDIKRYIMPIVDNYIDFNYSYDDTLEFIDSLSYDEYIETISNIDFSNYSVLYVKSK